MHRHRVVAGLLSAVAGVLLPVTAGVPAQPAAAASSAAPGTPGAVLTYGDAAYRGDEGGQHLNAPIVGMAATPDGGGYWLVASDGGIFTFGDAGYRGDEGGQHLNAPIVGMAATPDGGGYWLVASDGGIFTFGDAGYHGSTGGTHLNAPIVGMAATPDGGGYWLVASDGGIFTFGDAGYHGSTGGTHLNAPIVGMAATPDGGGYWLVASDGGIFTFGDAGYHGSTGGTHLNAPIVGMAATPDGGGYWLVASDGGIFTFGDAPFEGSAGSAGLGAPVAGIARSADGGGYWLVEGASLAGKVVTLDPGHDGGNAGAPGVINQLMWNGTGYEACDTTGTATDSGYPEYAFNLGVALDVAADLRAEGATVVLTRTTSTGVGPCVPVRAAIGNDAHSAAAISIHADGGPPQGRGFAVLEPVADGINNAVVGPSARLAVDVRNAFAAVTGEPTSTYDGVAGIQPRSDLGGLNLTTVPKVLIECANMRNATDALLTESPVWQALAARGIAAGITAYLAGV